MFRPLLLYLFFVFFSGILALPAFSKDDSAEQRKLLEQTSNSITKDYIRGWIFVVASKVFAFDHSNYTQRQDLSKDYFTNSGFRSFYKALEESGLLKNAVEKKQTLKGYIISPISVSDPKLINSNIYWVASFRYVLEYHQQDTVSYQFLIISADIKDTSDKRGRSIGLDRWLSSVDDNPVFCPCNGGDATQKKMTLLETLGKHVDVESIEEESLPTEDEGFSSDGSQEKPEFELPPGFPADSSIQVPYQ